MSPAVVLLGNKSLPFSLYDFHLNGVSAKELAVAYDLPLAWVEERIEAVRLCVKYQVELSISRQAEPKSGVARVAGQSGNAAFRCRRAPVRKQG